MKCLTCCIDLISWLHTHSQVKHHQKWEGSKALTSKFGVRVRATLDLSALPTKRGFNAFKIIIKDSRQHDILPSLQAQLLHRGNKKEEEESYV